MSGYELIRRLSSGGMGEVYLARLTGTSSFEKRVALKLMLPHLASTPDLVERFYHEARVAARMHHPNIVEVFDVGELEGRPFLAMQLVDGITLERVIKTCSDLHQTVPLPIIRLVATGLLEALGFAHELTDDAGAPMRVVHRDVTPGNVMLSRTGGVLLMDFGIARVGGVARTEPGVVRGKIAYLAPEQVTETAPTDHRADLFAAAVTLWELASFVQPFRHATDGATLHAIVTGEPAGLEQVCAVLTPQMVAALRHALERDPNARPPSARAFREEFVDGPMASGPELATWLKALSPSDPDLLRTPAPTKSLPAALSPAVGSAASASPVQAEDVALTTPLPRTPSPSPPKRPRRPMGALLGLVTAGTMASLWLLAGRERGVDQQGLGTTTTSPALLPSSTDAAVAEVLAAADAGVELAAAAPIQDAGAPASAFSSTPRAASRSEPKRPPRLGYISADAQPWADVLVQGQVLDRTPFARYPLPVGKHTLVFRGPNGETKQKLVNVTEGGVTTVRVEF